METPRAIGAGAGWRDAVEHALAARSRVILVLGATDRGKSAFCRFLSEGLLRRGHRVAFVDADLGQKTIGPPAAVTLGYPSVASAIAETPPVRFHFIGDASPARHMASLTAGAVALAAAARADAVVIDTDGMVALVGLRFKARLVEAVRPDLVIAIERDEELAVLCRAIARPVLRLAPAAMARRKSPRQRAAARRAAFGAYFQGASSIELDLADLAIEPARQRDGGGYLLPHRLCGTIDAKGRGTGLALIGRADVVHGTLCLLTPVPAAGIARLRLGELLLAADGEALGTVSHGSTAFGAAAER